MIWEVLATVIVGGGYGTVCTAEMDSKGRQASGIVLGLGCRGERRGGEWWSKERGLSEERGHVLGFPPSFHLACPVLVPTLDGRREARDVLVVPSR